MRWFLKERPPSPKAGDTKDVYRFLWFPKRIGMETRWLEWAHIRRVAYVGWCHPPEMRAFKCLKWKDQEFLNY